MSTLDRETGRDRYFAAKERELDRHRNWLAATNASLSWRLTAPLRAAKRLVRGRRAGGRNCGRPLPFRASLAT